MTFPELLFLLLKRKWKIQGRVILCPTHRYTYVDSDTVFWSEAVHYLIFRNDIRYLKYENIRKYTIMRLPKDISVHPHRTGRNSLVPAMVLAFLLPACATQSLLIPTPPPLLDAGPAVV
ncbi:MAG: hypothetical protein ACI9R7_001033, partial [Lysobacterales bacterium]